MIKQKKESKMNKETQKNLIEEKIAFIKNRRATAPPGQQVAIDTAIKFMTRAAKNINRYFVETDCFSTVMRTPRDNDECEELSPHSITRRIIEKVL